VKVTEIVEKVTLKPSTINIFLNLCRGKGEDALASNSKAPDLADRAML
jgi:hypothetical protein